MIYRVFSAPPIEQKADQLGLYRIFLGKKRPFHREIVLKERPLSPFDSFVELGRLVAI